MKIFFLLIFFSIFYQGHAQRPDSINFKNKFIRFNFSNLLNPIETNFSAGMEYAIKNRISLGVDLGYIFVNKAYREKAISTNGIMLRPSIRFYKDRKRKLFTEFEVFFKSTTSLYKGNIGRTSNPPIIDYVEFDEFKIRKNVYAVNFKWGSIVKLSRDNKFLFEFYSGLGFKLIDRFLYKEPNSVYFIKKIGSNNNLNANNKEYNPNLSFGARFLIKM